MKKNTKQEKVILIIRDGWGYRKEKKQNAIFSAKTPFADKIEQSYPTFILQSSGKAVGLPGGYQGNSEVGHITIGAGRIVEQSLVKINNSIKDKSFFSKKELKEAVKNCKKNNTKLHLIGLLQEEGVHSHINHLFALLEFCKKEKFNDVFLHIITDGRDSPVNYGKKYLQKLEEKMKKIKIGEVVTISGRYFAMDRDKRWERTELSYKAIAQGISKEYFSKPTSALNKSYKNKETDEFVTPTAKKGYEGIKKNDAVVFFNFRTDRPRQLTKALTEKNFKHFPRKHTSIFFVAMTNYYKGIKGESLFKEESIKNILGEVLDKNNVYQLRISETEKYAHVTFFFNNQKEETFTKEDRVLIPSPKISTYDKKPEMSIKELSKETIKRINSSKYQFIVVNLVNADMVGHSGKRKEIIKAVEAVDREAEKITKAALKNNFTAIVFADHGNAEDQRKEWQTSHTTNPVKLSVVNNDNNLVKSKRTGGLQDIAPTVLEIMKIKKPKEMLGQSLVSYKNI